MKKKIKKERVLVGEQSMITSFIQEGLDSGYDETYVSKQAYKFMACFEYLKNVELV